MRTNLIFLLLVVLLAACAGPAPQAASPTAPRPASTPLPPTAVPATPGAVSGFPVSIQDGSGQTLTFDRPPERVACLYTRCTEVLAALGVEPIALPDWIAPVAADPAYFDQPNAITVLRETNDDNGFDLEELAALKPDLILGWEELRAPFKEIAPVHVVTNDMDSYQESHEEIRAFARLFGREAEAEAAIQAFLDRLAAYRQRSPKDRSIMNLWVSDAIHYRDGQSGTCKLLKEVAGCDWPDPANESTWSVATSLEGLLQLDPDVIVTAPGAFADQQALLDELGKAPLWHEVTAFKERQIFLIPESIHNMDGMGTVGAARMLDYFVPLLYPEVFPEPLTEAQVKEIVGGSSYQITDPTGLTLTFDSPPERIICLYHGCIEIMSALGVEPVALLAPSWLPNFADDPAYFQQPNGIVKLQPQDSGSWDYEQIAALKPDLVFGGEEDRAALNGIALVHSYGDGYVMSNQDTLDDLLDISRLLGREVEARASIDRFQDRLAAYKELAPHDRSVLLVASDLEIAWIYAGASVPCSILNELAKCDWPNPAPQPGVWGYSSTVEEVLRLDPDVIIFENWSTLSTEEALVKLKQDPLWSELKAIKDGRIFAQTNRDAYGLGPVGGARLLDIYVPLIYPETFPEPLTDEQVKEIVSR